MTYKVSISTPYNFSVKVPISTPYNFSVKVPISTPYNFSVKVKQPPSFKTNFAFTLTEEVIPIMQ